MIVKHVPILSHWKLAQESGSMKNASLTLVNLVLITVVVFQEIQCSSLEVYVNMMIFISKS